MNKGIVYKITSPSGSVYIGQTKNLYKRLNRYKNASCKSQIHLYNSIVKYGWINHIFEILEIDIDLVLLNDRECYYIDLYKSFYNGMNMTNGGGVNHIRSQETIEKLRISATGNRNNVGKRNALGYKHTEEAKERIRQAVKLQKNPWLGRKQTKEHTQKLSVCKYKPVIQFDIYGNIVNEFESIKQASIKTGISDGNISSCCTGKRNTSGGFKWSYK